MIKQLMLDAFDLKRRGYYKQAIEIYYKILSSNGDDIEILSELADLYYLLGNNERALHYVNKALEITPDNISSLNVMYKVYVKEKKYDKAEEIALKLFEITNADSELFNLLCVLESGDKYDEIISYSKAATDEKCLYKYALALYNKDRYVEALAVLDNISENDICENSFIEDVLNLKNKIYLKQNDMENVKEVCRKLKENNATTAEGLNNIGINKLDEFKLDEAIENFSKAIEIDDTNAEYFYNCGQAYFFKGWFDEAEKCFNRAICLSPDEEKYHYSLAYLYYKSGNYESAQAHLNPEYFESKVLIQLIKSEKGDLASPKVELEKMLNEYPDNEMILFSLAKIYFKLDMYKQAKTIIEKTLEINQKPFEYHMFKVRVMFKLAQYDDAEKEIMDMENKYPKYYYAKVLEAELNNIRQDYDALFDSAQDLIELDINHSEGYYYNALALFEKEDVNFAIESLKKAISLDVANAELYVKMSEFYQAIGRYEDAFAYIKEAADIDKSAKNQELYMQLAGILRRKGLTELKQTE